MNFFKLIKKFKLSIVSGILLIVVTLLKNSYPENKSISFLSYAALITYILAFTSELYILYIKSVLKKEIGGEFLKESLPENYKINFVHDLKNDENSLSYKEKNLEKKIHNIALRTIVEVVDEGLRLYVVAHERDADGTPLYGLSFDADWEPYQGSNEVVEFYRNGKINRGFVEENLKVITKE